MEYPCMFGLNCPHFAFSEGDPICIAPYTRKNPPDEDSDETFPIIDNTIFDCPMMSWDSELAGILCAYTESPTIRIMVDEEVKRMDAEGQKIMEEIEERRRARENDGRRLD